MRSLLLAGVAALGLTLGANAQTITSQSTTTTTTAPVVVVPSGVAVMTTTAPVMTTVVPVVIVPSTATSTVVGKSYDSDGTLHETTDTRVQGSNGVASDTVTRTTTYPPTNTYLAPRAP
jgi:hypothetical protein